MSIEGVQGTLHHQRPTGDQGECTGVLHVVDASSIQKGDQGHLELGALALLYISFSAVVGCDGLYVACMAIRPYRSTEGCERQCPGQASSLSLFR